MDPFDYFYQYVIGIALIVIIIRYIIDIYLYNKSKRAYKRNHQYNDFALMKRTHIALVWYIPVFILLTLAFVFRIILLDIVTLQAIWGFLIILFMYIKIFKQIDFPKNENEYWGALIIHNVLKRVCRLPGHWQWRTVPSVFPF